jgi:hypothetical protein
LYVLFRRRGYANVLAERRKELEKLGALFSEARDEIENAREVLLPLLLLHELKEVLKM